MCYTKASMEVKTGDVLSSPLFSQYSDVLVEFSENIAKGQDMSVSISVSCWLLT